jgi:senataxin
MTFYVFIYQTIRAIAPVNIFDCSLGFLEAPAFEDGILEKYPIFLNIVLNHVSDDGSDLSCAVSCLKASFEMLGECDY